MISCTSLFAYHETKQILKIRDLHSKSIHEDNLTQGAQKHSCSKENCRHISYQWKCLQILSSKSVLSECTYAPNIHTSARDKLKALNQSIDGSVLRFSADIKLPLTSPPCPSRHERCAPHQSTAS